MINLGLIFSLAILVFVVPANADDASVGSQGPAKIDYGWKIKDIPLGIVNKATNAGSLFDCARGPGLSLEALREVPVIRMVKCEEGNVDLYEVLFDDEKTYYVPVGDISLKKASQDKLSLASRFDQDEWASFAKTYFSLKKLETKEELLKKLRQHEKLGISIVSGRPFDISEYTDGAGYEITFYNPTKKSIKYVSFVVTGFNAVDDVVFDRMKRVKSHSLRAIGPIAPNSTATYSFDYVWFTDIVETASIGLINIIYMDGSKKAVSSEKLVRINDELLDEFDHLNSETQ